MVGPEADGNDRVAMMAVLAHTLMNSVSAVLGLLDTLIDHYERLSDDDRREILMRVRTRVAFDADMLVSVVRVLSAEGDQPSDIEPV